MVVVMMVVMAVRSERWTGNDQVSNSATKINFFMAQM